MLDNLSKRTKTSTTFDKHILKGQQLHLLDKGILNEQQHQLHLINYSKWTETSTTFDKHILKGQKHQINLINIF